VCILVGFGGRRKKKKNVRGVCEGIASISSSKGK
jgi:hypothetical protein